MDVEAQDKVESPLAPHQDYWTWERLNHEVRELCPVDRERLGPTHHFLKQLIRHAVIDLQDFIPAYRKRHETIYYPQDFAQDGQASVGTVPPHSKLKDCWIYNMSHKRRYPVIPWAWERRFELAHRRFEEIGDSFIIGDQFVVLTTLSLAAVELVNRLMIQAGKRSPVGLMAVDPQQQTFYVFPAIRKSLVMSIFWEGRKLNFRDDELVPMGEDAAFAIAAFVQAKIAKRVDRDIPMHDSYMAEYFQKRTNLFINEKDRSDL